MESNDRSLDRRKFIKLSAATAASGDSLLRVLAAAGKEGSPEAQPIYRNRRPEMTYRPLGRTNFMASRLAFGIPAIGIFESICLFRAPCPRRLPLTPSGSRSAIALALGAHRKF